MIHQAGLRVFIDAGTQQPQLSVTDFRVGFLNRDLSAADAFYFAAQQRNTAFEIIQNLVIVPCLPIPADMPGIRIVRSLLFLLLAGHTRFYTNWPW